MELTSFRWLRKEKGCPRRIENCEITSQRWIPVKAGRSGRLSSSAGGENPSAARTGSSRGLQVHTLGDIGEDLIRVHLFGFN